MLAYVLAALLGWVLGVLANRFIYDWAWFAEYSLSPWGRKPTIYARETRHRLPLLGWFWVSGLRGKTLYPKEMAAASEEEKKLIPTLGVFSRFRPLVIELLCIAGLPLLMWWYFQGGLLGDPKALLLLPGGTTTLWVQWASHSLLLWLMLIAAAIDWDERTIPDQTTVTGMVLGIAVVTFWPAARLPQIAFDLLEPVEVMPLHLLSPDPVPEWLSGVDTLLAVILSWTFWAVLTIPKTVDWRYGPRRTVKYMVASVTRPQRSHPAAATRRRVKPMITWITGAIWLLGILSSCWAWIQQGAYWEGHATVVISMALAGLGTWLVRVLASMTVGDEALGFGDVTLMFMIGAAFGWQFALMTFVMGPLLSLFYAVANMIITGEQKLAFGPWLCAGAGLCLIFWAPVWDHASHGVFSIGAVTLMAIIGACLALLPPLLWLLLTLKKAAGLA